MFDFTLTDVTLAEDGQMVQNAAISVKAGRIVYAGPLTGLPLPPVEPLLPGKGWLVAPGFIDLQLNGGYGFDFTQQPDTIPAVAARLPETGVVAFLPTFITSPLAEYPAKLDLTAAAGREITGAFVLGAHLEGPFLNPAKCGAHRADLFVAPEPAALAALSPLAAIRLVTLAPEQPAGLAAIRWLREQGIVVSMGHSAATTAEALAAIEAGVGYGTHLFNAMRPLDHREPGLAGVLLTSTTTRCGLIVDGIHVHPRMVQLAWQSRGAAGLTLVTDAMAALGMPPGQYAIGGQEVRVDQTGARLADGRLAGSILRMDQAVRNMVTFTGCSIAAAIRMASTTPAEVLGLDDRLGHLRPGYPAHLVVLDHSGHVQATIVAGRVRYATSETGQQFKESHLGLR
jgi:N-acetylglucosamine-6-phosphate deacetylase